MSESTRKHDRVLELYSRLLTGEVLHKDKLALEYGVTTRSIQRDIDSIRDFCSNQATKHGETADVIYDRTIGGFRLVNSRTVTLTNAELFAVSKILLENRSLSKAEMEKNHSGTGGRLSSNCRKKENVRIAAQRTVPLCGTPSREMSDRYDLEPQFRRLPPEGRPYGIPENQRLHFRCLREAPRYHLFGILFLPDRLLWRERKIASRLPDHLPDRPDSKLPDHQ